MALRSEIARRFTVDRMSRSIFAEYETALRRVHGGAAMSSTQLNHVAADG
jgi:hypothetical protein